MQKTNYQELFFEKLKNSINPSVNPVYEIADLLQISNDAAYRRLRGEKLLNLNEIILLCKHFNLSIDELINGNSNEIKFNYMPLQDNFEGNYTIYIKSLRDYLRFIVEHKSSVKKIYFAATDIPIFHLCKFPELKAFKIYTWKKQFNRDYEFKFSIENNIDSEMRTIFKNISELYDQVDSYEIWTRNTFDTYLKYIQYYFEIDCFESKSDAIMLLDKLSELVEIIKGHGEKGFKTHRNEKSIYNLFLSEIELESNLIYAETDNMDFSFIKLYSINTISTSNQLFCSGTKTWFESVINKSILISGFSQKQFLIFFREITKKIEYQRSNILTS